MRIVMLASTPECGFGGARPLWSHVVPAMPKGVTVVPIVTMSAPVAAVVPMDCSSRTEALRAVPVDRAPRTEARSAAVVKSPWARVMFAPRCRGGRRGRVFGTARPNRSFNADAPWAALRAGQRVAG